MPRPGGRSVGAGWDRECEDSDRPLTTGSTSIYAGGCSASVTPIPSGPWNINNGDDAKFYYNFTWSDTRTGPPPPSNARHYFNLTVSYTRYSGDVWTDETHYTSGTASGSGSLNLTVYDVREGEYIGVTGIARISLACSAYDSQTGVLYLT